MAIGLQLKNGDDQILVDSEFEHYHYAGKATHYATTQVPDMIGGNIRGHTTTAGQYISPYQQAGDIFKFKLYVSSSVTKAPMCFIKPVTTGASAPFAAIVLMSSESDADGFYWDIWVLQDEAYERPSLYCFLPLSNMTAGQKSTGTDTLGLATYNSNGDKTYDSRLLPLKIIGTASATSPSIARTGQIANGWNPDFRPDQQSDFAVSLSTTETSAADLMYYCPSFAHACQDVKQQTSGDGFQAQGYNSYFYAWARIDLWWTFYRATFRFTSQSTFQASYTPYACGHVWDSAEDSSSILGALVGIALAAVTFGASLLVTVGALAGGLLLTQALTGAGVADGLYYPYSNSSRNAGQANPVLISKSSYYEAADNTL